MIKTTVGIGVWITLPKKGNFEKTSIEDGIFTDRELKLDDLKLFKFLNEFKIWFEIDIEIKITHKWNYAKWNSKMVQRCF